MRELTESLLRFSWAMTLFGVRQAQSLLTSRQPDQSGGGAADAFEAVARATAEQLEGPLKELFHSGDRAQRGALALVLRRDGGLEPGETAVGRSEVLAEPAPPGTRARPGSGPTAPAQYDSTHLVLGEGLAAGMGDFSLSEESQQYSFPNLLTRQMGVRFVQPLIQPPGIGTAVGFPGPSPSLPAVMQTTVLEAFPPPQSFSNLAVPGLKIADVLTLRPVPPLIHRDDPKQTAVNLLLGLPDLLRGSPAPLPTPVELAVRQSPLCIILELGYYDFLEPAVTGNLEQLPDVAALRADYARILDRLAPTKAEVLLLTVPDPTDTAHFSTPQAAARCLRIEPAVLDRAYRLPQESLVTVNGLLEIAWQVLTGQFRPLRPGSILGAEAARAISGRVQALNAALLTLAKERRAVVYDLHGLLQRVRRDGVVAGGRRLTGDYLGGFYSLNGYYPGPTGQAVIAGELVDLVNSTHGTTYAPPDLRATPVADYRPANGRMLSWEQITRPASVRSDPAGPVRSNAPAGAPAVTPQARMSVQPRGAPQQALRLPPGFEQILPLNKSLSYHGDAIRVVHCRDETQSRYGSCGGLLFGGLAMFGSHVSGSLRVRFAPPINGVAHFEVDWGDGLVGDDGVLSAPQFFRLPVLRARVLHWPGTLLSGDLNLETGETFNLDVKVRIVNSALDLLIHVNPNFPKEPVQFPGEYGTAWARFEQRSDGNLDFTFYGKTFVPLGGGLRFPLPFGASDEPAHVPAAGTALHPQLCLSTKECEPGGRAADAPEIPFSTVQEFTAFGHNTSFGDFFSLNAPELGTAQGRSQVLGRVQIQFGERFSGSVPVAVFTLPPGGMLAGAADSPLTELFPGRLPGGLVGHDEFLRFPLRTYFLDGVSFIDDPFDLALGAVNVRTGKVIGELTHRGFIDQNLFFALVRIEPRTPRESFFFQGPACFERGVNGQLVYRFNGTVHIPYPEGYKFPSPDLTTAYVAGPNSALDPFFRLQAMGGGAPPQALKNGGADNVIASNGNTFSYRYSIPRDPAKDKATFEYINHTQGGAFRMCSLAWHGFTHSRGRPLRNGEYDTVTFTGFGAWSKGPPDKLCLATVQISTSREYPYVSIQIDGGLVSNVNTKPADDNATLP